VVPALAREPVLKAGGGGGMTLAGAKLHASTTRSSPWAMVNPLKVGAAAVAGLVLAGFLYTGIGSTFMPVMTRAPPVVTIRKQPHRQLSSRRPRPT
jgi:multidrug efflux pump subunit AcrB